MFPMLKREAVSALLKKDKDNYVKREFKFNIFIQPHQFKNGGKECHEYVKRKLGKYSSRLGGFPIYYHSIKMSPFAVTKAIQGGAHVKVSASVVVFKASEIHPFTSQITAIDSNFALGQTCGIVTRFKLMDMTNIPNVGDKVKCVLLQYSDREGIFTLTCGIKR